MTEASDAEQSTLMWVDALRLVAAYAVVVLHVLAPFTWIDVNGGEFRFLSLFLDAGFRWSVPLFVMLSGSLLLPPRGESVFRFYVKRSKRILLPVVFWTGFYSAYSLSPLSPQPRSLGFQLQLIFQGRAYYHVWFLYMLLGLYVYTPFLRAVIAKLNDRDVVVLCLIFFGGSYLSVIGDGLSGSSTPLAVSLCGAFAGYYLLGYLLCRWRGNVVPALFVVVFSASFVSAFALSWLIYARSGRIVQTFHSPAVMLMAASMFLWARSQFGSAASPRWFSSIGATAFGIYLTHPMVLECLGLPALVARGQLPLGLVPVVSLAVFAISGGLSWALLRLPGIRHTL